MKLRVMIELDLGKLDIPDLVLFEMQEQRALAILGLERYVSSIVAKAGKLPVSFGLKVTEEEKK